MTTMLLALLLALPPQASGDTADRFAKALQKLGADDYQDREAASAELAGLPAEALKLVEAELKKADLDAEVRTRLERAQAALKSKARLGAEQSKKAASIAWTRKTTVEAYEKIGRKDDRWNEKARQALTLVARVWENEASNADAAQAFKLCSAAIEAGCDDPMVIYARARMYPSSELRSPAVELQFHLEAAAAMKERGARWHELRQCYTFARAADALGRSKKSLSDDEKKQVGEWLELAVSRLEEGASDREVPERQIYEVSELMTGTWMVVARDRKIGFDRIFGALTKARPDSAMPLVLKGDVYISYAWDARGSGWANSVTDDGWKKMGERLNEAEQALTAAWKKDPTDPRAPTLMIGCELGQGKGRAVMETWYKRAMDADPDNQDACKRKMYYLEPKWHGDADAMLGFGRELLAGGNWKARLPFGLIDAHLKLAGYDEKPAEYWKNEAVWQDVKAVYDRALKFNPGYAWDQTYYARLACYCEHWTEAKALFDKLGDKAEVGAFRDRAELDRLRGEAAAKGK